VSVASDLVGADIMGGDPDSVSLLARRMSNLATDVEAMRDKFSAQYLGGIWTGEAFEAFAKTLEDVPADLAKVSTSYSMAANAVGAYSGALEEVQRRALELATQSTDAESQINAADGDLIGARREVKLAKSALAGAVDPVAQHDAQRRLQYAVNNLAAVDLRHQQATAALAAVHGSATAAVTAFKGEVRLCCQRLHDASEAGIQNTLLSAYNRHVADTPLGIVIGAVTGAIGAAVEFGGKLAAGDLAAWRKALDIVGYAVAVATIVVVVVGTGGLALVLVGAAGVAVAGAALAVDTVRYRRGDISKDELYWDLGGLALSAIPFAKTAAEFAPAVGKAAQAGSAAWTTRYIRYGVTGQTMTMAARLKELRMSAIQAIFDNERSAATRPTIVPGNLEPCVVPRPGIGASPLAVIRHVRPIVVRPIALADVA
jgi:uncharacterized protein YukE